MDLPTHTVLHEPGETLTHAYFINSGLASVLSVMSQDRLGGEIVPLTQEFLAHMLGTRRASVTVAAGILQKAGLITYNRGSVRVDDRSGLEDATCECYASIKQQSEKWEQELSGLVRYRADTPRARP